DLDVFPRYVADLQRSAEGLPVRFMGRFEERDVSSVYQQFDVLVVPSLWLENSPLVIHEAFMAGVPVVGARIGGIADLIEDGRTGLLYDPAETGALAAALRSLLETPRRLDDLSVASRRGRACERSLKTPMHGTISTTRFERKVRRGR